DCFSRAPHSSAPSSVPSSTSSRPAGNRILSGSPLSSTRFPGGAAMSWSSGTRAGTARTSSPCSSAGTPRSAFTTCGDRRARAGRPPRSPTCVSTAPAPATAADTRPANCASTRHGSAIGSIPAWMSTPTSTTTSEATPPVMPSASGISSAVDRFSVEPGTAGHQGGDEGDQDDDRDFGVVQPDQQRNALAGRGDGSARPGHAPLDEGEHREDLERQDEPEESHLDPEVAVAEVEVGSLLDTAECAQQAGRDPEQGRDAPETVRGEEAPQSDGVPGRAAQFPEPPSPREDRAEPDRESEYVE